MKNLLIFIKKIININNSNFRQDYGTHSRFTQQIEKTQNTPYTIFAMLKRITSTQN